MAQPKTIPFGSPPLVKPKTMPFKNAAAFPKEEPPEVKQSFFQKLGGAAGNFATGVYKGAASTVSNVGSLGQKGLDKITKPISEAISGKPYQSTPTLIETFKDTDKITPTTTAQKVGFGAEQVAEFFIPGGAATKAGKAAGLAAGGSKLAKAASFGAKAVTEAGTFAGLTAAQGGSAKEIATAGIIGGALPVASKILKAVGKGVAEAVIPISAKEAKLLQAYQASAPFWKRVFAGAEKVKPNVAGATAFNKGLLGTESMVGVQAKAGADNLWKNLIGPSLKQSPQKVGIKEFFAEAQKQIIKLNPEISRQKDLLNALNAFKKDYKGIGTISLEKLQSFKEGWAKFVPEKAYKGLPIAGAFNDVKDILADNARKKIYEALGGTVKQAYFDYGNLKGLQELGQKAMTGGKFKGGFGSFWNAVKDVALVPIGTIGGQVIYKVGSGIELFGKAGATFIKDIIPEPE